MSDYTKMIEQIKLSEMRVASLTKEMKECEAEIKKLDDEKEVMNEKEKQLKDELEYKRKIVNEKEWELQHLKRRKSVWIAMLEEKQAILVEKKEELAEMQQKVWDTRKKFYECTQEFLINNDFFREGNLNIQMLIKKREEKQEFVHSVEELDKCVSTVEKEHNELKAKWDLLQHLEKDRENLIDYEQSPDVIRLQNKINAYSRELEMIEKELMKYSERAVMRPEDVFMLQSRYSMCSGSQASDLEDHDIDQNNVQEKRQPFVPKISRFQVKIPSSFNNKYVYDNHYNNYHRESDN